MKRHFGIMLRMAALLGGAVLLSEWLAENPNGWLETHAAQGTRMVHGDPTFLDLQSTVAIVTILITVTIIFENIKHFLEHKVPPMMSAVLSALFGELTVLGFLALYAFFMLQTGVIQTASVLVYGDSERMVHLFEEIHFLLFFVIVIFLLQAFALVRALMAVEQAWHPTANRPTTPHRFRTHPHVLTHPRTSRTHAPSRLSGVDRQRAGHPPPQQRPGPRDRGAARYPPGARHVESSS